MPRYLILSFSAQAEKTPRSGRFSFSELLFPAGAASLLWLSWLVPLHFPPWVSWHSELLSFFTVFLLAWYGLLYAVKKKDRSGLISFPVTALPLFALWLIASIQGVSGQVTFVGDVLVFGLYLALYVMCLALGFASSRQAFAPGSGACHGNNENPALTFLAVTLTMGAFASAVVAFAQVFELWEHSAWINRMPFLRRPGGNLGQPNHLATLLLMGIASLLFLYELRKLTALPSALILLVLCMALAVTESRTGVLSFLLLSGWWFVKNKGVGFRLSSWVVALAGIGFLAFFWEWPSVFAFILQSSDVAVVNTSAGLRLVVWPQLLEALTQRPWWGWGLGEVSEAHNAVVHAYPVSQPFSYSHNILLDLALGMGVPLTALLLLVTGIWSWRRVRTANQLLPWYCLAVALPVAVHSMLEFPFAYAYFLVPVMFALGALEGMGGGKPMLRIGVRPLAALLLGFSILGAWSVVEYLSIEEDFRVARFEALRLGQTPSGYQKPNVILLTQMGALLEGARISPRPGMSPDELALAKKMALRFPWPATQNRYALSLALNGNPDEAVRQLRVMKAMHGNKTYREIEANWNSLAQDKYPQLRELTLP